MQKVEFWHNPRCSKSRQALQLLRERGIEPKIVLYLEDPPSERKLRQTLKKLGCGPDGLLRRKEKVFRELGLGKEGVSDSEKIRAMVEHPILIERPVVIAGDRAVVARPPEKALEVVGG